MSAPAALLSSHHKSPDFDTQLDAALALVDTSVALADMAQALGALNTRNENEPGFLESIDGTDVAIEQPDSNQEDHE